MSRFYENAFCALHISIIPKAGTTELRSVSLSIPTLTHGVFRDGKIKIPSYNLETVLAEKLDTILSRAENNTRMRDFYDVCYLNSIYKEQIKNDVLKEALFRTSGKRKHQNIFDVSNILLQEIVDSFELQKL